MKRCVRKTAIGLWALVLSLVPAMATAQGTAPTAQPAPKFEVDPLDWYNWRGPELSGVSREKGLPDTWSPEGENLLWKSTDLAARSSPIVMRGKIFTINNDQYRTQAEGERIICADAATGKTLWTYRWNVFLSDCPDTRVGWSNLWGDPTTGYVYAHGVGGMMVCVDGETGKLVWQRSLTEEYGLLTTYGGRTNIPIVHEDLVIISGVLINWGEFSRPTHRFLAFNKLSGEQVWIASTTPLPDDTTYSMPIPCVLGGQAAIVFGAADGWFYALQPRTGKEIWKFHFSQRGLNLTPLVSGNTVYMGSSEENVGESTMGYIAAIDGTGTGDVTKSKLIWGVKELGMGRGSPLLLDGKLFCPEDTGKLLILNAQNGETIRREKLGTIMRASPVFADGKIYCGEANGRWYTFALEGDKLKALTKLRLDGEIHGSPAVSHGRVYIPTTEALYCIGLKDAKPAADPIPPLPVEDKLTDMQPATVQVVPAEVIAKPGDKIAYRVRLFNAKGQYLKDADNATFESPLGTFAGGTLTTNAVTKPDGGNVTVKVGELTGQARLRVFPALPWKFDFADKDIPVAWLGMRYRHVIREVDGETLIAKITTIPKGTRSQGWIGAPDMKNYTIQADMKGIETNGKLPDMGLIAQRYRFDVQGASQSIKLYSWIAHELKFVEQPFAWKGDVWYTLKFKVSMGDREGKAVSILQGKIWPRGEAEPSSWTIETVDIAPDTEGAPGLFGNAKDTEIFIDNITVTPNE